MGDITKNISRYELACSCGCGDDTADFETINVVQGVCHHFAKKLGVDRVKLIITSPYRCLKYNRLPVSHGGPGSNDNSQHPKGRALDIQLGGVSPKDVYDYLHETYPARYGVGSYPSFTHIDTRTDGPARW